MSSHLQIARSGTGKFTKVEYYKDHWKVWIKSPDFINGWYLRLYNNGRQEVCYSEAGSDRIVEIKQVQEQ